MSISIFNGITRGNNECVWSEGQSDGFGFHSARDIFLNNSDSDETDETDESDDSDNSSVSSDSSVSSVSSVSSDTKSQKDFTWEWLCLSSDNDENNVIFRIHLNKKKATAKEDKTLAKKEARRRSIAAKKASRNASEVNELHDAIKKSSREFVQSLFAPDADDADDEAE